MADYLEIGDAVYHKSIDRLNYIGEVSRVTKTLAFVGNLKFRREVVMGNFLRQPGVSRSLMSPQYVRETPEIKKQYCTQVYLGYIQNRIHDLAYDDLENIFYKIRQLVAGNTKTTE